MRGGGRPPLLAAEESPLGDEPDSPGVDELSGLRVRRRLSPPDLGDEGEALVLLVSKGFVNDGKRGVTGVDKEQAWWCTFAKLTIGDCLRVDGTVGGGVGREEGNISETVQIEVVASNR